MKRNGIFAIVLLACCVFAGAARADLAAGLKAYHAGKFDTALKEFRKDKSARALYNVGVMYMKGEGVATDPKEGVAWLRKAADRKYADAEFTLGYAYYQGVGVERDEKESAAWIRKAAEHGSVQAQFNLGIMYTNGEGVSKDHDQAVKWYKKAARGGNANARKILKMWGEA